MRVFPVAVLLVAAACARANAPAASPPPAPELPSLAFLAAQHVIVTPTYALRVAPSLGWSQGIGWSRDEMRAMDADLRAAFAARGLEHSWIFPEQLADSYKRNPTYAADPYALAEEALRSPRFIVGTRLAEPLATQLRTMIALQENARLVLLPVELRFEAAENGTGRASLRVAVVDPRFSEARWVGDVQTDTTRSFSPALTATLAQRLADLVVAKP